MQAFASPVKNRTSYLIDLAGVEGFWAPYPIAGNVLGLTLTVMAPEPPVNTIACGLRRLPIDNSPR
jgi:hypothetical protein